MPNLVWTLGEQNNTALNCWAAVSWLPQPAPLHPAVPPIEDEERAVRAFEPTSCIWSAGGVCMSWGRTGGSGAEERGLS